MKMRGSPCLKNHIAINILTDSECTDDKTNSTLCVYYLFDFLLKPIFYFRCGCEYINVLASLALNSHHQGE